MQNWDQPLLFQKHGGVLAILVRNNNGIIEFLLNASREPGDGKGELKLCPSFSATQSNINLAHGSYLHTISDTNAHTYHIRVRAGASTLVINRRENSADYGSTSYLTVMEIAG